MRGSLHHLRETPHCLPIDAVNSAAATHVKIPYRRCAFYPLAAPAGAMSKSMGLPAVFFVDNATAVVNSCMHKDITSQMLGLSLRIKYWVSSTAELGSGTSTCLDPMLEKLRGVLQKCQPRVKPAQTTTGICLQIPRMHLSSNGYLLQTSSEAGSIPLESWPTSGTMAPSWTQPRNAI